MARSAPRKAKPTREKVQAHRDRMRAQGLKLIQIWVPDLRNPVFQTELARQVTRINKSKSRARDAHWIDAVSDWSWAE